MSNSSSYSFKWNTAKLKELNQSIGLGSLKLAYAIGAEAQRGTPVLSGALVNSMRVTDDHQGQIYILMGGRFNDYDIPYGKRQEYENPRHPYFMKNAFVWGEQHYPEYYKGITK